MAAPGGNQYGDKSDAPLSDEERRMVQRMTTDPLAFDEKFTFWLQQFFKRQKIGDGYYIYEQTGADADDDLHKYVTRETDGKVTVLAHAVGAGSWLVRWREPLLTEAMDDIEYVAQQPIVYASTEYTPVDDGTFTGPTSAATPGFNDLLTEGYAVPFDGRWVIVVHLYANGGAPGDVYIEVEGAQASRQVTMADGDTTFLQAEGIVGGHSIRLVADDDDFLFGHVMLYPITLTVEPDAPTDVLCAMFETRSAAQSDMGFYEFADATNVVLEFDYYIAQESLDHLEDVQPGVRFFNKLVAIGNKKTTSGTSDIDQEVFQDGVSVYTNTLSGVGGGFMLLSPQEDIRDGVSKWHYCDYWSIMDSDNDDAWASQTYAAFTDSDMSAPFPIGQWVHMKLTWDVTAGDPLNLLVMGDPAPPGSSGPSVGTFQHFFDNIVITLDGGSPTTIADFEDSTFGLLDVETDVSGNQTPPGDASHPLPGFNNGIVGDPDDPPGTHTIVARP